MINKKLPHTLSHTWHRNKAATAFRIFLVFPFNWYHNLFKSKLSVQILQTIFKCLLVCLLSCFFASLLPQVLTFSFTCLRARALQRCSICLCTCLLQVCKFRLFESYAKRVVMKWNESNWIEFNWILAAGWYI